MASYTLKVLTEFASAHTLTGYPGACSRMHGHNWKVEVEVISGTLDQTGMALDFKRIKQAANEVGNKLDHQYLNDIPPFNQLNPTAENIAAWFFQELSRNLNTEQARVHSVTLWETDRACVKYSA
jgi:6-pyruvoyltetrahydropterin/6-carboxytetrahydropterin synthase